MYRTGSHFLETMPTKKDFCRALDQILEILRSFDKNLTKLHEEAVRDALLTAPEMSTAPGRFMKLVQKTLKEKREANEDEEKKA